MKKWKKRFAKHILERGFDYYQQGLVTSVQKNATGYRAVVEGTEDYSVEILVYDNEEWELQCDCPYADGGNYCKHMAAVMYQIEQEELEGEHAKSRKEKPVDRNRMLKEIIERIPLEELRGILLQIAKEDKSLGDQLLMKYAEEIDVHQIMHLKKEVNRIAHTYMDDDGFIDYHHAWEYVQALLDFMQEKIQILIDRDYLAEAFALTNHAFLSIDLDMIDDSDGGIMEIADVCMSYWKQILKLCSEDMEKDMFHWFTEQYCSIEQDYLKELIGVFLMENFQKPDLLHQKLTLLDAEIEGIEKSLPKDESSYLHFIYEDAVARRYQVMKTLGCSKAERNAYKQKYHHLSNVRRLEINEHLENREYEKAIRVLLESKEIDHKLRGLVSMYSEQLIELYQQTGQMDAYKNALKEYVFCHGQRELTYVHLLKEQCDIKEWEQLRDQLLLAKSMLALRYELLISEGMYERMLNELEAANSIYTLDYYEKTLRMHFPEKTRDLYIAYIKRQVEYTSDRKGYKQIMKYLKKIKNYPGGKEEAKQIVEEWKKEYKRRPAMMDELEKAGF